MVLCSLLLSLSVLANYIPSNCPFLFVGLSLRWSPMTLRWETSITRWGCGRAGLQVPTVCQPWGLQARPMFSPVTVPCLAIALILASRLTSWPEQGPASSPWVLLVLGWTWPPFPHLSTHPPVCVTALGSQALAQGTPQLLTPILLDDVRGPKCLWALKAPIISFPPKQEHYLQGCHQTQSEWLHLGFPKYFSDFFCWNLSAWKPLGQEKLFIFS